MAEIGAVNDGMIWLAGDRAPVPDDAPRTFLVTGAARSGTSMLARLLAIAGIHMGPGAEEPLFEDVGMRAALNDGTLEQVIDARNARRDVWGFKCPDLHDLLPYWELDRLRGPRLICAVRDPVAAGRRMGLGELIPDITALTHASQRLIAGLDYVRAAPCPALLVSYEKATTLRESFVDGLAAFCGLRLDEAMRARMIDAIEPNRPDYINVARRRYEGHIDTLSGSYLFGWCRNLDSPEPVDVVLCVDGNQMLFSTAGAFREDLRAIGMDDGRHGFAFDIAGVSIADEQVIDVRVAGREVSLAGGGRPLGALRQGAAADEG